VQVRKLEQEDGQLTKVEREELRNGERDGCDEARAAREAEKIPRAIRNGPARLRTSSSRSARPAAYKNPVGWAKVQWKLRKGGKIR
jgi:hypothetical protein